MDWVEFPFEVKSDWFTGSTNFRTNINELLGTKLRALYQRSKGRDLFDLDYSRLNLELDHELILKCFKEYMAFSVGKPPSQKEFLQNIEAKENDPNFIGDMEGLLRKGIGYDKEAAFKWLKNKLITNS